MTRTVSYRGIDIINDCKNPPKGLERQVRRSLSWINEADLTGIGYFHLRDELPDVTPDSPKWYKEALKKRQGVLGWYNEKNEYYPANIMLHVKEIYYGVPSSLWWTTVPTLLITATLAHEVGHHLLETRGFIFNRREECKSEKSLEAAANQYSMQVINKMYKCWHYRLGKSLIHDLANFYYQIGRNKWNAQQYQKAADHWHKARRLNPDHELAAHWYWRALDMLEAGKLDPGDPDIAL